MVIKPAPLIMAMLFAQAGRQSLKLSSQGTPILQHGLAGAQRGGQWAWGQQGRRCRTHSGFLTSFGMATEYTA